MNNQSISCLKKWRELREQAEVSDQPIELVKSFFQQKPSVSFHTDPCDPARWPEPWELIAENIFCDFTKILAICYTLQLTTKFTNSRLCIYTLRDKKNHKEFSVLFVDEHCISYQDFDISEKCLTSEHIVILSVNDMSRFENI